MHVLCVQIREGRDTRDLVSGGGGQRKHRALIKFCTKSFMHPGSHYVQHVCINFMYVHCVEGTFSPWQLIHNNISSTII